MDPIRFAFEGLVYDVSTDAYELDLPIELPDGRWVRPQYWQERAPLSPEAINVHLIEKDDSLKPVKAIVFC